MMSKDIQRMLQECLDGYDGGLAPEECLSAYPGARAELEPLLRQALSLRVAFAASPSPEFRLRAREKLLFAAGRDVVQALASDPDPEFVQTTRQRLLNTAGAGAQEALRDVPPPRLPFWANARRRLLETASTTPPRPAHTLAIGMRSALSAAVVVLAVAIAGAGFLLQDSPANQPPRSASADIERLSEGVESVEQLQRSGEAFSSLLDDLATLTNKLAEDYATNPDPTVKEKLPDLIERQRALAESSPLDETVALAQQRLDEADQKVAAAAAEPTSTTGVAAAVEATEEPTEEPTAEATPTLEIPPVALVSPADLAPGVIARQYNANMTELGLRWSQVTTSTITFDMPASWNLHDVRTDENGLAVLPTELIFIETDVAELWIVVNSVTGEVTSIDPPTTLRDAGKSGTVMTPLALAQLTSNDVNVASLFIMLDSIAVVVAEPEPTETPAPTETPSPTPTATPTATATPESDSEE